MAKAKKEKKITDVANEKTEILQFKSVDAVTIDVLHTAHELWLSKKMMASLFGITIKELDQNLKMLFASSEFSVSEISINYQLPKTAKPTLHYHISVAMNAGFQQAPERAREFLKWAVTITPHVKRHLDDIEEILDDNNDNFIVDFYFEALQNQVKSVIKSKDPIFIKYFTLYGLSIDYPNREDEAKGFFVEFVEDIAWFTDDRDLVRQITSTAPNKKKKSSVTTEQNNLALSTDDSAQNKEQEKKLNAARQLVTLFDNYLEQLQKLFKQKIFVTIDDWLLLSQPLFEIVGDIEALNKAIVVYAVLDKIKLGFENFTKANKGKQDYSVILKILGPQLEAEMMNDDE